MSAQPKWWIEGNNLVCQQGVVARINSPMPEDTLLLVAAPDLLEALRDMVSDHANLSEATLQFARASIAKATGEQS